jgi:hypothetical protein
MRQLFQALLEARQPFWFLAKFLHAPSLSPIMAQPHSQLRKSFGLLWCVKAVQLLLEIRELSLMDSLDYIIYLLVYSLVSSCFVLHSLFQCTLLAHSMLLHLFSNRLWAPPSTPCYRHFIFELRHKWHTPIFGHSLLSPLHSHIHCTPCPHPLHPP